MAIVSFDRLRQLNRFDARKIQFTFLLLRLAAVILLAALLTVHVRSLRAFRWEQTVSGGVLITFLISMVGLALDSGVQHGEANSFQVYICATGSVLLALNAAMIYRRWKTSGQLTRMVAELLGAVGVPLRRQVYTKVSLGVAAAVVLFVDMSLTVMVLDG